MQLQFRNIYKKYQPKADNLSMKIKTKLCVLVLCISWSCKEKAKSSRAEIKPIPVAPALDQQSKYDPTILPPKIDPVIAQKGLKDCREKFQFDEEEMKKRLIERGEVDPEGARKTANTYSEYNELFLANIEHLSAELTKQDSKENSEELIKNLKGLQVIRNISANITTTPASGFINKYQESVDGYQLANMLSELKEKAAIPLSDCDRLFSQATGKTMTAIEIDTQLNNSDDVKESKESSDEEKLASIKETVEKSTDPKMIGGAAALGIGAAGALATVYYGYKNLQLDPEKAAEAGLSRFKEPIDLMASGMGDEADGFRSTMTPQMEAKKSELLKDFQNKKSLSTKKIIIGGLASIAAISAGIVLLKDTFNLLSEQKFEKIEELKRKVEELEKHFQNNN